MALSIGELVGYVGLDTSKAESAADKLGGFFEGKAGTWAKVLGGVGAAGGAALATGLVGAINLEPSRDRVAAALQLTEAQAEKAGKVSAGLYADAWGESEAEVDTAIEAVISSIKGMRTASEADLTATTEAALTFATAMGVDVSKASATAGNMIANGLAKDGVEAFDLLAAASSKVPVELREDVLDATNEYGQFFTALGIDGPAAMGLLAEGAAKGMYGIDKAGDAIKEFTIRATDGSASTVGAFDAIGLNSDKMANDLLAGGDKANGAFGKIVDGLLGIEDPGKRANTAIALFGTPLEDLGTKDIPKFLQSLQGGADALGKFEGATADMGATMNDNAATNLKSFTRAIKTGFVEFVGGKALPAVTLLTGALATGLGPAFDKVGGAVESAGAFIADHQGLLSVTAGIIATVFIPHLVAMGVASTVSAAKTAAGWVVTQVGAIKAAAIHSGAIVKMVAGWALMGAKSLLGAAKVAASWLIAMGPIGLVIALVAGLVVVIVKNWDTIKTKTKQAWDWVSAKVADAWDTVRDKVSGGVDKVVGFVKAVPGKVKSALSNLVAVHRQLFADAWQAAKSKAGDVWDGIAGWLTSLPGKAGNKLSAMTGAVREAFRTAMQAGKDRVTDIGGTIVSWIEGIPGKILNKLGAFSSAGRQLLQGFVDGMRNAAGVISGIAGNVWSAVRGLLNGAIARINAALSFTINLPGKDLSINPPDIPMLATGGRATAATLAVIGEGREPESVLPDSVLRGLLERAHAAGLASSGGGDGRTAPLIGRVDMSSSTDADEVAERLWFKMRTRG